MFNPQEYIKKRPDLFNLVDPVDNQRPLFYLATDHPIYNEEKNFENFEIGLPYIPKNIEFSYASNYNTVELAGADTEYLQYTGSQAQRISFNNIILDTRSSDRSFKFTIDTLLTLMYDKAIASYFYIAIQNRVLYPYVLNDMTVNETGWINGYPVRGTLDLNFTRSSVGRDKNMVSSMYNRFIDREVKVFSDGITYPSDERDPLLQQKLIFESNFT